MQISDVLSEIHFPANKDALVDAAREAGASNEVLSMLDGLPEQDYADVDSVTRLIGGNYPHGRLLDEILFRLTPEAGAARMPRGMAIDPAQQRELERYFTNLAQPRTP